VAGLRLMKYAGRRAVGNAPGDHVKLDVKVKPKPESKQAVDPVDRPPGSGTYQVSLIDLLHASERSRPVVVDVESAIKLELSEASWGSWVDPA